jgi:hypothetical protein
MLKQTTPTPVIVGYHGSKMGEFSIEVLAADDDEVLLTKLDKTVGSNYREAIICILQRRHLMAVAHEVAKLREVSAKMHTEVGILANSSGKLEQLTERLNHLTWVLIILTVLAIASPIGIEVWKAYHEPQPLRPSAQVEQKH